MLPQPAFAEVLVLNSRNFLGYIFLAAMAIYGVYHKIESQDWIKTTATIERTRFRENGAANRTYSVTIFYSYNADGLRHSGSSTSTDHR